MKERFKRNIGALTAEEQKILSGKKVFVAGCGGLGGYIIEMLSRLGCLNITVADGDVFGETNLNRQILCTENNLGKSKAQEAAVRIKEINSDINIIAHSEYITEENAEKLLQGHDVIIDALDNIPSRLLLEKYAEKAGIPIIHGAIQGWLAQIAVIMPGDRLLEKLYKSRESAPPPVPSFTPAFCASLQVSEAVKLLCGKETLAKGELLVFDLTDNSINKFTL